jgi:hypothetical protein
VWQKNIFKILFALIFIFFPLGQFFKIDGLVLLTFITWLIVTKKTKEPLFKPFLIFFLVALFSLLLSFPRLELGQFAFSALYLARVVVYSSLYFITRDLLKNNLIDKNFVLNGLIFTGLAFSIIGIMQYIVFPDMRIMKYLGWDDHYYRIVSTFFDPNFSGIIYACTSLILLRKYKFLFVISFIALLFTYSRTAYLSFFFGLSIYLIQIKKIKYIFISLIIILLILKNLPTSSGGEGVKLGRVSSVNNRIDSIKTGLNVFIQNPIIGIGFNTYRFLPGKNLESHSSGGVENSYVLILLTTGILGFLAFINILKKIPIQPEIVTILVSALFINSLFYPWIMIYLFSFLAVFKENI